MSPIKSLWQSRKFLLLLLDTIISLILFGVSRAWPGALPDVEVLIGLLQPVFVALITAIAIEDAAAKRAGYIPGFEAELEDPQG